MVHAYDASHQGQVSRVQRLQHGCEKGRSFVDLLLDDTLPRLCQSRPSVPPMRRNSSAHHTQFSLGCYLTDVRKANKSKVNIWLASTANVPADITITANATVPEDHVVLLLNMLHQLRFPTSVAATTVAKPPAQMGRSFAVFAENSAVRTMPNVGEHCVISVSWGTVNCTVYLFQ